MKEDDVRKGRPSASGMQRIALCPGSWLAEQGCPDVPSEAAEAGTRLHRHMELGSLPEDPVETEAVEWCRQMERQLLEKYVAPMGADRVLREKRWWAADGGFSGQADVVFVHVGCALVLDYKFGRVPVAVAANNLQLAALALLAFEALPEVQVVFCGILQPLASRQVPRLVRFKRADLHQLRAYFRRVLTEAEKPNATRVPGEEQCRYCRAKADCPACSQLVARETLVDVAAAWPGWSPEKKAGALRLAGLARKWADAVERKAKADLKDGFAIPGFALGAGRCTFAVTDAQGAFAHLNALIGVTGEEFAACCTVKISELDKIVHAKLAEQAPDGTKQLVKKSREWLRDALEDFGAERVSEGSIKSV